MPNTAADNTLVVFYAAAYFNRKLNWNRKALYIYREYKGMKGSGKYISVLTVALLLSVGASAQKTETEGNDKRAKATTSEQTSSATASAAKKTTTAPDKSATPPEEKKKWALRVKQGEKWYQLSLELSY